MLWGWKPVFTFFNYFYYYLLPMLVEHPFQWKHMGVYKWLKGICGYEQTHWPVQTELEKCYQDIMEEWNHFCFPQDSSSVKLQPLFCVGWKKPHPAVLLRLAGRSRWRRDERRDGNTATPPNSVLCLCLLSCLLSLIVPVIPININTRLFLLFSPFFLTWQVRKRIYNQVV